MMKFLSDMRHVDGPFGHGFVLVQDRCMVCAKCTTRSETILDAPDGTPR
jgi:hypothetical protein